MNVASKWNITREWTRNSRSVIAKRKEDRSKQDSYGVMDWGIDNRSLMERKTDHENLIAILVEKRKKAELISLPLVRKGVHSILDEVEELLGINKE